MTAVAPIQKPVAIDVPRLLQSWCDLWSVRELAPEITVEFSTRMTRSLGRCYPDRRLIRIATFVVKESDELFQEVLCHEAAHLAAYHLHGTSIRPHGLEWKALMQMAGYAPNVRFKGTTLQRSAVKALVKKSLVDSILDTLVGKPIMKVRVAAFKKRQSWRRP